MKQLTDQEMHQVIGIIHKLIGRMEQNRYALSQPNNTLAAIMVERDLFNMSKEMRKLDRIFQANKPFSLNSSRSRRSARAKYREDETCPVCGNYLNSHSVCKNCNPGLA